MLFMTCVATLFAEENTPGFGIVPAGAPFYTPDTGVGAGIYTVLIYDDGKGCQSSIDQAAIYATATMKKQTSVGVMPDIFFSDGLFRFQGIGEYSLFPSEVWGIGSATDDDSAEIYTPQTVVFSGLIYRPLLVLQKCFN